MSAVMNNPQLEVGSSGAPAAPVVSVQHLNKVYESKERRVEAIGDLSFEVRHGDFTCIVGPSGAGKTTLLKCLSGLLAPTRGTIRVNGHDVTSPPEEMAIVFQEYGRSLFPWKTVRENVELPLRERKVPKDQRRRMVDAALEAVALAGVGDSYPWQLSGGMQQRVAIARAVAYQPKVMVLDEPFAAVDAQTRADLEDLMLRLWSELDLTVIFVTHDIDEAVYLGQRVLVLSSSPTRVLDDVPIDIAGPRTQALTRVEPGFAELRTRVYQGIQAAKAKKVAA
ncbi:ABC transporter ATP-binding protein [Variovorax ginsengisoli]|uniref:ABC transporter ATP-binding protein n=1 Tax=Variovorax ginsengisoli TaxID=363844 RepID=A0ABT8SEF6_9BURK|nr:ABC transporter ATP-binding protein [Variovorax ginsengisoli]MDN8617950.1 ABC transporter ATP-binding protein [Variovorax ginsengisoli]MDO1537120.1 ABC transporter ATP-binding protein [Variovorax ginsengisoli]